MSPPEKNDSAARVAPLFQEGTHNSSFAEECRDQVKAIHEEFDKDKDGFLNMDELARLQHLTAGTTMDQQQYLMVCKALNCEPNKGIHLPALKLTYAADGTDLEDDYFKVFPERQPGGSKTKTGRIQKHDTDVKKANKETIYEAGVDGFDISS